LATLLVVIPSLSDDLALAMPSNMIVKTESDGSTRDTRIYSGLGRSGALNPTPVGVAALLCIRTLGYRGCCS
jgi:hypothetical protein